MTRTAHDPRIGTVLGGRYELVARLGEGGMACAYRGRDRGTGESVAVKVLHPDVAANPEMIARFEEEARLTRSLSHPNIVAVLDGGTTPDGVPYLAMELVTGRTLAEVIAREHPLPMPRVARIFEQLLDALDAAHRAGVVHADVKSDNIIVAAPRGKPDRVKLVDFGLAAPAGTVRASDVVSGTPEYLAPEVARGDGAGVAADVYGAGVVLYELLTGRPPFTGATPLEVMRRQLDDAVVPPSLRADERSLSADLDAAVLQALEKDPARRFASAAALARAVLPLLVTTLEYARHAPRRRAPTAPMHAATQDFHLPDWVPANEAARRSARPMGRGLRARLGSALRHRDREQAVSLYVDLAARMARNDDLEGALAEIAGAVDVLTGGAGPGSGEGPLTLWRLLLLAARLEQAAGHPGDARASARQALRCAERAGVARDSSLWHAMERLAA